MITKEAEWAVEPSKSKEARVEEEDYRGATASKHHSVMCKKSVIIQEKQLIMRNPMTSLKLSWAIKVEMRKNLDF